MLSQFSNYEILLPNFENLSLILEIVLFQICGPEQCPLTKKETVCRNETETVIHEVPDEECSLNPKKNCNFITKMIPK